MTQRTRLQNINRVLVITLILNLLVAFGKIILGAVTGALAITADGFHSIADAASNVAALVANTIASKAPDDTHPYGHERFETLAALFIGMLLILTAWETLQGVISRLIEGGHPMLTPLAFAVMIGTLIINIAVNRYQVAQGRKFDSQLLLADAAHTGADVYVTLSVLGSMAASVLLGWQWVDMIAALIVIVMILRVAWGIVKDAGSILVDTAPLSPERIASIVMHLPSVQEVTRVRSRGSTGAALIDIRVRVASAMTAAHASAISAEIDQRIRATFDGTQEVNVQFEPVQPDEPNYGLEVRALADSIGLSTHNVRLLESDGQAILDLHVEVPAAQTLDEAHAQASDLEERIRARFEELDDIVTHIEPAPVEVVHADEAAQSQLEAVESAAQRLLIHLYPTVGWHKFSVHAQNSGYVLLVHAALPPQTTIEDAHQIAEQAEAHLQAALPQLERITIHTEPAHEL